MIKYFRTFLGECGFFCIFALEKNFTAADAGVRGCARRHE